jgi:hypothetical protein
MIQIWKQVGGAKYQAPRFLSSQADAVAGASTRRFPLKASNGAIVGNSVFLRALGIRIAARGSEIADEPF